MHYVKNVKKAEVDRISRQVNSIVTHAMQARETEIPAPILGSDFAYFHCNQG